MKEIDIKGLERKAKNSERNFEILARRKKLVTVAYNLIFQQIEEAQKESQQHHALLVIENLLDSENHTLRDKIVMAKSIAGFHKINLTEGRKNMSEVVGE